MKKLNVNVVKVLSIASMVVGAAGSLLSSVSQEKTMQDTIKKEVEKALQNQK